MKRVDYAISRIPVFLFLTIVVYDLIFSNIRVDQVVYEKIFYVASEIIGASLTFSIFMLLACFRYKLCWYNKVSVFGLLALNTINFIGMTSLITKYEYYTTITHVVMIPTAVLAIILLIKRR